MLMHSHIFYKKGKSQISEHHIYSFIAGGQPASCICTKRKLYPGNALVAFLLMSDELLLWKNYFIAKNLNQHRPTTNQSDIIGVYFLEG